MFADHLKCTSKMSLESVLEYLAKETSDNVLQKGYNFIIVAQEF